MKNAKEMFEELGYKPYQEGDWEYKKTKLEYHDNKPWIRTSFVFDLKNKQVYKRVENRSDLGYVSSSGIDAKDLKVIYKQFEELGWYE